uniref:Uncharacterized protein n=1 Tax=Trichuris muris TaxID=70415 RepID=A0A5S6R4W9_TRIMR
MSDSSQIKFSVLNTTTVDTPSWFKDGSTIFESGVAKFINLLHPSYLPLDKLVGVNPNASRFSIVIKTDTNNLLEIVKEYDIAIAVIAMLPFVLLFFLCICCCAFRLTKGKCCGKSKSHNESLPILALLLFFSGTILIVAAYTLTSSLSLDRRMNEFPDTINKSINYINMYDVRTQKTLDHLLTSNLGTLIQFLNATFKPTNYLNQADDESDESSLQNVYKKLKNAKDMYNKTLECLQTKSKEIGTFRCIDFVKEVDNITDSIEQKAVDTASTTLEEIMVATEPQRSVRSVANGLMSAISYIKDVGNTILRHSGQIQDYDFYRRLAATIFAVMICVTSLGLFAVATLLIFHFGPKGKPCHPGMSEKSIKKLLMIFSCFANVFALLGSAVFLGLFVLVANLHVACRPLENAQATQEFFQKFSATADGLLHSLLKSHVDMSQSGSTKPLFNSSEVSQVVDKLNTTTVIQRCGKNETMFVILNLNTFDFPEKLKRVFESSYGQSQTSRQSQSEAASSITVSKENLENCTRHLKLKLHPKCNVQYINLSDSVNIVLKKMENVTQFYEGAEKQFRNIMMKQLLEKLLPYGKHLKQAFEKDILPCNVVNYPVGGLVNIVCWSIGRKLNGWTAAIGLWSFLVIFTVLLSKKVSTMLDVDVDESSEED